MVESEAAKPSAMLRSQSTITYGKNVYVAAPRSSAPALPGVRLGQGDGVGGVEPPPARRGRVGVDAGERADGGGAVQVVRAPHRVQEAAVVGLDLVRTAQLRRVGHARDPLSSMLPMFSCCTVKNGPPTVWSGSVTSTNCRYSLVPSESPEYATRNVPIGRPPLPTGGVPNMCDGCVVASTDAGSRVRVAYDDRDIVVRAVVGRRLLDDPQTHAAERAPPAQNANMLLVM